MFALKITVLQPNKDLEQVFCANSKKAFLDLNANELSNIEASQMLKTGRHKWTMWPWEIADSFEGECIEETCTQSEVVEFCSRSDQVLLTFFAENNFFSASYKSNAFSCRT